MLQDTGHAKSLRATFMKEKLIGDFKIHLGFVLNRKMPRLVQKVPEPETAVDGASTLWEVSL